VKLKIDLQLFADPDRTERATPRRRRRAREEGNVPQSRDLNSAITFMSAVTMLFIFGMGFVSGLKSVMTELLGLPFPLVLHPQDLRSYEYVMRDPAVLVVTLVMGMALVGLLVGLIQTKFLFAPKVLRLDFNRVNPVQGLKRLFSLRSVVELLKSLLKVTVIGYVAYTVMRKAWNSFQLMPSMERSESIMLLKNLGFELAFKIGTLLLIFGVFDYFYQRWEYERNIRMTKQEVKEEYKEVEGHPEIKRRQRQRMVALMRQRMMQEVPKADVVITNPIHYAIALRYDPDAMGAPVVVAKGKDQMAERIKEIAEEHGVPIVRNPELARALYYTVEIGEEIPEKFYRVVAEVLAHVYTMG